MGIRAGCSLLGAVSRQKFDTLSLWQNMCPHGLCALSTVLRSNYYDIQLKLPISPDDKVLAYQGSSIQELR